MARLASHAANKWSSVGRGGESRTAAGITINTFKCELFHAMTGISGSIHTQFSRRVFGDHDFLHFILRRY